VLQNACAEHATVKNTRRAKTKGGDGVNGDKIGEAEY